MHLVLEAIYLADIVIRLLLTVRIVMRRRPVGDSLAWLTVVLVFPIFGAFIYLLFGELRLGNRRALWVARVTEPFRRWIVAVDERKFRDWSRLAGDYEPLARIAEKTVGVPPLPGNQFEMLADTDLFVQTLLRDIDAAEQSCHMEFYIWADGGVADQVAEALLRARERGVDCRILVDDVGSNDFVHGPMIGRLRDGGVKVTSALPAGWFRSLFVRFDLRMHRKIIVIDGRIGYTGSQNMVDPRYFKVSAGVGQWVDAMVRIEGPAVEVLEGSFLADWYLELDELGTQVDETMSITEQEDVGETPIQVVPSGPLVRSDAIQKILLTAIYSARRELTLTTPYFVPDESLRVALASAAQRGVNVTLIVPAKVDSRLVSLASRSYQDDLASAGVRIALFDGGLLHTKSITIDGEVSFFGSLNLDPRSLHLNFEITLVVYDKGFASELSSLQQSYMEKCELLDPQASLRGPMHRFAENTARLFGPLL